MKNHGQSYAAKRDRAHDMQGLYETGEIRGSLGRSAPDARTFENRPARRGPPPCSVSRKNLPFRQKSHFPELRLKRLVPRSGFYMKAALELRGRPTKTAIKGIGPVGEVKG